MAVADALAAAEQQLDRAARFHKRSAAAHRREAKALARARDQLRRELAEHGVELDVDTDPGGHSHAGPNP